LTRDFEELLEALVNCFDTSASKYTLTGEDGTEVEVDQDTGLVLEQAIQALYGGTGVYDSGEGDLPWD
jgi:hypothetical protein